MNFLLTLPVVSLFISASGVFGDEGETDIVSVNEGDSVTLHTQLTDLKEVDVILWRFNGSRIARINREKSENPVYEPDERFTDRLKMNPGSLTITNITSEHTGEYQLVIVRRNTETKSFSVVVSPEVKTVMDGDSVTLHIDATEKQRNDKIHWKIKHNNSLVAEIITENGTITKNETYNGFRGRLKLDDQTGSLTITNMTKKDAGQYEADVTIGRNTHTIHKTFSFTDSAGGLPSGLIAAICVVLVIAAAVVAVGIYCHRRSCTRRPPEEDSNRENELQPMNGSSSG